jgi:hypothetical protein
MSVFPHGLSRRRFLTGAGVVCLAPSLQAETTDGMQVLRALPGAAFAGEYKKPSLPGYDGTVPGPMLRIKRGDELRGG